MQSDITRKIEFDTGHRIPYHGSKCKEPHGHRYVLEATGRGLIQPARGKADDGMVIDFGVLKQIMMEQVHDAWDHRFLVWEHDTAPWVRHLLADAKFRPVALTVVPTAENLCKIAYERVARGLETFGAPITLVKCRLYETPNCWAEYPPESARK